MTLLLRLLLLLALLAVAACEPLSQLARPDEPATAQSQSADQAKDLKADAGEKPGAKAAEPQEAAKPAQGAKAEPKKAAEPEPVSFILSNPYLRIELPGVYKLAPGGPAEPGLLLRAKRASGGGEVVVRAIPLDAPVTAVELGPGFLAKEQDRLRRMLPGAQVGPARRSSVAGLPALGFSYQVGGQSYNRYLVPAGEWLYELTHGPASAEAPFPWIILELPRPMVAAPPAPASQDLGELGQVRAWAYSLNPPDLAQARQRMIELRRKKPRDPELVCLQAEVAALQALTLERLGGAAEKVPWHRVRAWAVGAWRKNPKDAQALRGVGLAKLMEGDRKGAREYLIQGAELSPPDAGSCLGLAFLELKDPPQAEEWARKALAAQPRLTAARLVLAWSLEDQNRPQEAAELYDAVLRIDPDNRPALMGLARALMDKPEKLDRAGVLLAQMLKLDPAHRVARFDLALVRYRQKRYAQAEELAQEVARQAPGDAAALNLAGLAQAAQGRYPAARDSYQAALAVDPNHVPALFNLGVLCATELDDVACARQAFQRFLQNEGDSQRAEQARAWLVRHGKD